MPTLRVDPSSDEDLQDVANALLKARKVVVITGAGISTNSGIPVRSLSHLLHLLILGDLFLMLGCHRISAPKMAYTRLSRQSSTQPPRDRVCSRTHRHSPIATLKCAVPRMNEHLRGDDCPTKTASRYAQRMWKRQAASLPNSCQTQSQSASLQNLAAQTPHWSCPRHIRSRSKKRQLFAHPNLSAELFMSPFPCRPPPSHRHHWRIS